MSTYWITTAADNLEFLESLGISVGPRKGDTYRECTIPPEAFEDLAEVEGNTLFDDWDPEEQVCWGPESRFSLQEARRNPPRCTECRCVKLDGKCTYPLCASHSTKTRTVAARRRPRV